LIIIGKFIDLTNQIFGKLIVLNRYSIGKYGEILWLCKCECGNETIVRGYNLRSNHTQSCGCLNDDIFKRKYNIYNLSGEYGIGYTFKGEPFYFDLEDYNKIKDYCWSYNKKHYLITNQSNNKHIKMHQLIIGYNNADHINRMPYDNRKNNFRPANQSENVSNGSLRKNNTTGIIGVYWRNDRNKYTARIKKNYHNINLGCFDNINDAIRERLKAEKEYFGEFAPQQHLFKEYGIT
jgi:hypothetical protein